MLPEEAFPDCRLFHIDGREQPTIARIVERMRTRGARISIDTGSFREPTLELLPLMDWIIMPRRFPDTWLGHDAPQDIGEAARLAAARFPQASLIVVTDGARGAAAVDQAGTLYRQPAFRVKTIDTTGAGDAHCGALLTRLLTGDPPQEALRFAAACAALKASRFGNGRLAGPDEAAALLQSGRYRDQ